MLCRKHACFKKVAVTYSGKKDMSFRAWDKRICVNGIELHKESMLTFRECKE